MLVWVTTDVYLSVLRWSQCLARSHLPSGFTRWLFTANWIDHFRNTDGYRLTVLRLSYDKTLLFFQVWAAIWDGFPPRISLHSRFQRSPRDHRFKRSGLNFIEKVWQADSKSWFSFINKNTSNHLHNGLALKKILDIL